MHNQPKENELELGTFAEFLFKRRIVPTWRRRGEKERVSVGAGGNADTT